MAEIIKFSKRLTERDAAILRMSRKLLAHLTVLLYDRGLHDRVPLHTMIADMEKSLLNDGVPYDPELMDSIGADSKNFKSIERKFIERMIRDGWLPADFR
jgi:hypothetical protein